jgi:hypothetical protein
MQHTATYSPDDNKLRIYPGSRLDDELGEEYADFKRAGYKWAAKQECFVCPKWSPQAEDWALRLCGEIGDEDYSYTDRAADRAERFTDYRDKRRDEAGGHADDFESGPSVFGHQNQRRAERQAERHDRHRTRAICQWSKAEYWQTRTAGVIAHAMHKASPATRRGRINTLEAEQRKHEKGLQDWRERRATWQKIATMEGADELLPLDDSGYAITDKMNAAQRLAYSLANSGHAGANFYHPTSEAANAKAREVWGHGFSAYDFLTHDSFIGEPFERLAPKQYADMYLRNSADPDDPDAQWNRWCRHYELRLAYERAMLENEGGSAAAVEIEPGGWINFGGRNWQLHGYNGQWLQVQKVSKSPKTKQVTSVTVLWVTRNDYDRKGNAYGPDNPRPLSLHTINIQRLGENAYRTPTDEERAEFQAKQTANKKARKATAPKAPALINPTDSDAERLQVLLNAAGKAKHDAKRQSWEKEYEPTQVLRTTQAKYSELSKGAYSRFETRTLHACGRLSRKSTNLYSSAGEAYDRSLGEVVCKLRTRDSDGWHNPQHIVIITDKPQKPIPLNWEALAENPADELASA